MLAKLRFFRRMEAGLRDVFQHKVVGLLFRVIVHALT